MDYVFICDDKELNISFGQSVANYMLNMKPDEAYTISYQLDAQSTQTVPLKLINHEYIGSIDINLISVSTNLPQGLSNEYHNFVSSLLPDSLGKFDCYNDFNNNMGTITLVKKTEPVSINCNINKNDLAPELLQQLGLSDPEIDTFSDKFMENAANDKELNEVVRDENSALPSDDGSTKDKSDREQFDQDKIIDKQKISESSPVIAMTIRVEGTYGFNIPLNFDQFNSN
jgi:hypothetical protein